jgi:translation initiation factor eIF-2B subunit beta
LKKIKPNTICLTEREVFNFMGRVTKVFLSTKAIFADGSFLGQAGCLSIASCAQLFSVPVFLLSPSYFFTPLMTFNQKTLCPLLAPQLTLDGNSALVNKIDIEVPLHDVVPSSMVKMIISEYGADSPDYIFRVFAEHYSDHDYGYKFD